GEIEAQLRRRSFVEDAVVVAEDGPGGKQLVGYVVLAADGGARVAGVQGIDGVSAADGLRASLREQLPAYMIPARVIPLASIPRTHHGKVDRRALPRLRAALAAEGGEADPTSLVDHVAPTSELGRALARIWCDVLGVTRIGVHDNFFELGGQSVLALQVINRIEDELQMRVPLRCLFEADTLGDFERVIVERGYWFAETGE
ncbi:MAG: phosphopantetheine-binding protein, partial [Polyangiales bacterium]